MNILQTGLALALFVTVRGEVKRELGFTGIGSYHGAVDAPNLRYASGNVGHENHPGKLNDAVAAPAVFHVGSSGFGKNVLGFTDIAGYSNNVFRGGHQGYGGFSLNSGYNSAPLFSPVSPHSVKGISLDQAPKTIFYDQGWKEILSGPGSIKEGHAIANAAFEKGQHKNVIPVYEPSNDIPQAPKVHSGFAGFGQITGNHGGHSSFGGSGLKGFALPVHSTNTQPLGHGSFGSTGSNFNVHGANHQFSEGSFQGFKNIQNNVFQNNKTPFIADFSSGSHGKVNSYINIGNAYRAPSLNVNHGSVPQANFGGFGHRFPQQHSSHGSTNQFNIRHGFAGFQGSSSSGPGQTSLGHGQTASGHAQTSSAHGQTTSGHGQTSSGHGQTSSGHGQTSSGHGQTSSGHGQTSSGHGQSSSGHAQTSSGHGQTSSGHSAKYVNSNHGSVSGHNSLNLALVGHGASHGSSQNTGSGAISHETSNKGANLHQTNQFGSAVGSHSIPSAHGTNGHAAAHGHNTGHGHSVGHGHDEKATSFQSFVIHSYKPVPVYAKKPEYKHEAANGKSDGSHTEESRNYNHQSH